VVNWTHFKTLVTESPLAALRRRNPGFFERYVDEIDEYGFDLSTWARWEPFFRFCFEDYFKVDIRGIENIPAEGAAIVVGNHSGVIPVDGAMMSMAMGNAHYSPRRIRYLASDWFFDVPIIGDWMKQTGQVRGSLAIAEKLLQNNELIGIYPEGVRGVGKPFHERYRVIDFHPGFVKLAIASQTPIIPVATVGGDEIYPNFINVRALAQFLRTPFFPVTPGFPWLPFPLWLIPLPVRWLINVHKPVKLEYPPERANDRKLVRSIAREIQYQIQRDLNDLFGRRKTLFTGWDDG
jgi:1-acyl-sn-glycerol-3-phosphate acyltransferase